MFQSKWIMILLVMGLTAFDNLAPIESLSYDPCTAQNLAFNGGEEIVYKMYYNWNFVWLPAGEVIFRIKESDNEYHISATGITYKSYEWFFKVRDYYATTIDKETLLPKVFIRDIHEGNFTWYNRIDFDQVAKKAVSQHGKTKETAKTSKYNLSSCMHDILSLLYYLRNVNYANISRNDVFQIKMFLDEKEYALDVKYQGVKKNMKIKGGDRYNTLHFSPNVIAGNQFNEGTVMEVYVSDDNNKVPVLIESPVSVGSVKAVLVSHKGLRHPFSAKLN
jgi:hypothetical protein